MVPGTVCRPSGLPPLPRKQPLAPFHLRPQVRGSLRHSLLGPQTPLGCPLDLPSLAAWALASARCSLSPSGV
eukprot:12797791-Heterocapsa_arctica.AAC.1